MTHALIVHTNHRRKRPRHRGIYYARQSYSPGLRVFWAKYRAQQRVMMLREEYDLINTRTRHTVQWDDW